MSLEPHWFSAMFGLILIVGQVLSTLAFVVIVVGRLAEHPPLDKVARPQHFHDFGNLMLAFTMIWAYLSFSQFLIIWAGNLPETITWYQHRSKIGRASCRERAEISVVAASLKKKFYQAEDGIRDGTVTGVQTCALPIFSFSQFLIIWAGNLPETITWYQHRSTGGWQWLALGLFLFSFALPFVLLLSRRSKRRAGTVALVGGVVLGMRLVEHFWLVAPTFRPGLTVHWMDLAAPIGIGGLWLAFFFYQLKGRPTLPQLDPRLKEAFADEGH